MIRERAEDAAGFVEGLRHEVGRLRAARAAAGSFRAASRAAWRGSASTSMRRISMPMRSALTVLISRAISWMAASVCRLDREVERGGEADGAEHAEFVFAKPQAGVADGADDVALRGRRWPPT